MSNPLVELQKLGQSIWYDNIRRALIATGDIARKIEQDDLRGVTSNPSRAARAGAAHSDAIGIEPTRAKAVANPKGVP